jgi:SanA protein
MAAAALRWIVLAGGSVAAGGVVANGWIRAWTRSRCYRDVATVPRRPVAIVPGARVHPDGQPSTALEDRLAAALDLLRRKIVSVVLVSGAGDAPEHDEAAAMRRWLTERGVTRDQLWVDPKGTRTLDTMRRAAEQFDVLGAIVCTQAFHLPRSVFLARRAGIDAVGLAADQRYATRTEDRLREFCATTVAFGESYAPRWLAPRGSRS